MPRETEHEEGIMNPRKIGLTVAVAALVAGSYVAGRLTPPPVALAQHKEHEDDDKEKAHHGRHGKLDKPHTISIELEGGKNIGTTDVVRWDIDEAGDLPFLRITRAAGEFWYLRLDKVVTIHATPQAQGEAK